MSIFVGQLGLEGRDTVHVSVQIEEGRCRIWSDRKRLGSWDASEVGAERLGVFRFLLNLDGQRYTFLPDDPSGFGDEVGAVVDLRTSTNRFGLADRLRQASGEQAS